jgi:Holliday junction resolvase RusA-like endonuclease
VGKWGVYYARNYALWMQQANALLMPLPPHLSEETMYVSVSHVCKRPKTTKLPHPNGDVDNYLKGTLDAITKAQLVWHDDKQIKTVFADKRFVTGSEEPHTFVRVGLTLGVLWLAEPIVQGEDIYERADRVTMP